MTTRPWIQGLIACIALLAVNAPNLTLALSSPNIQQSFATVIAPAFLLCVALYVLLPRFTPWLLIFLAPLALLETLYIMRYERPTDEQIFAIIRESNFQEATAWLGPAGLLLLACALLLLLTALGLVWRYRRTFPVLPRRWRIILLTAGLSALGLIHLSSLADFHDPLEENTAQVNPDQARSEQLSADLIGEFRKPTLNDLFPWGVPLRIQRYLTLQKGMNNARETLGQFRFDAQQSPKNASDDEIVLLVIGETGRPDRWQLNGYERPTNPRLKSMPGVVSLTNATTGWAWTRMSVPVIISRKPSSLKLSYFPERSIVGAFREAGFWTAWYSTQGALGFHESAVALYAGEAEDVRFINPAGYRSPGAYDTDLLTTLDTALARPERKKFIVLHTLGSHFNYAHRVPPEFEVFKPSLRGEQRPDLHDRNQKELLNNSYDNSIRYTDHVLAEIVQRLNASGKVASLLYIADHGENLFDGDCDKSGHGHNTEYDYRVAALWWNGSEFSQRHPEKVAAITAHRDSPWSTENVFDTLLDAADISLPPQSYGTKSLLQKDFSIQPRWIQSGMFFDEALREGNCHVLAHPAAKKSRDKR
ncbi:putative membrane-associated, metal-dependent hydrolase [Sterolibacterium denitrificans]|uniref:Membrane-associated, metal-dependent hydrolase n=1 Tax=Sterolibacterium denitrificans TaxID=157592 RepID=A0A7Z7HTL2_9PROT|nr:phosphoethanolamine transferase [Sterolibacterium denitrificans]SMB30998.1 putative membrane-associated, metal-dependent hydrolase [Sterolibacterium denitrificans]